MSKKESKCFCVNEHCSEYCKEVIVKDYDFTEGMQNFCSSCSIRLKQKRIIEPKKNELTIEDVKKILKNINFSEYSCIDMGWEFEIQIQGGMYMIRTSFMRKDIDTGKYGKGWGRWHTTPVNGATETSIVMTAWVCVKMIVEHELLEGFEYKGKKVFNPHKTIDQLVYPDKLNG